MNIVYVIRIPLCGRKEKKKKEEKSRSRSIPVTTGITILKMRVPSEVISAQLLLSKVNELVRNAVLVRLDCFWN